jgi:ketosteroid isomerase-like protein
VDGPETRLSNVDVVRALWDATRDRAPERALALMDDNVVWIPLVEAGPPVQGREALAAHFDRLLRAGVVADAHGLAFEAPDADHVIASGALRVRRPDNWITTVERWWVYRLRAGRILHAQTCATREEALACIAGSPPGGAG